MALFAGLDVAQATAELPDQGMYLNSLRWQGERRQERAA
jgi:hypothetical protein